MDCKENVSINKDIVMRDCEKGLWEWHGICNKKEYSFIIRKMDMAVLRYQGIVSTFPKDNLEGRILKDACGDIESVVMWMEREINYLFKRERVA